MLLWLTIAFLTAAASLAVLLPLASRRGELAGATEHDLEVYKDQLAELERDAARGLIGGEEAEQAKAEIGRRILRIAGGTQAVDGVQGARRTRVIAAAAVLAVPLLSWGLYAVLGSPDLADQPLQARMSKDPSDSTADELVRRAEEHLRANPSDGRGWDVLAPIYLRMNRPAESVTAYRNAMRLLGATARRESGLGEALVADAGGVVTAEAAEAFERALQHDRADPKSRFFLASAMAQEGRLDEAADAWRRLARDMPQDSPWQGVVAAALEQAGEMTAAQDETMPGPTREDIEAASDLDVEGRAEMIEGMVARLDARLRENPADLEGWQRLVRSYLVLGRKDDALAALERGIAALGAEGGDAAETLRNFAAQQGLQAD
ncbi:c-type cytochrome biogenesis protein CcmI [Mesorhizobium xinjiangense]|uniref:c-type cytochrome biogenesis protein CcmI n=1 Tax=Mesorhizobium xinjiangense TaxID=2678685 RepID=UPI0012ECF5FE|nr:c-type cytochrome biogenesis protein CcmI [Mesorhizobium xinjiangense]